MSGDPGTTMGTTPGVTNIKLETKNINPARDFMQKNQYTLILNHVPKKVNEYVNNEYILSVCLYVTRYVEHSHSLLWDAAIIRYNCRSITNLTDDIGVLLGSIHTRTPCNKF